MLALRCGAVMTHRNDNRVTIEDLRRAIACLNEAAGFGIDPIGITSCLRVSDLLTLEVVRRVVAQKDRKKATERRLRRTRNNSAPNDDRNHHKRQAHKG